MPIPRSKDLRQREGDMMHRTSTKAERPSFGMGVVAVAVGVGYGVVDTIARRVHDHGHDVPAEPAFVIDVREPDRVPVAAGRTHAHT
jgi:hypothetical protein